VRYILHITLDTGHTRRSPRAEVDDVAIAAVQDGLDRALAGGRPLIPGGDCTMTATAAGKCLIATAWSGGAAPLVTVGVAAHSRCGARLWRALHEERGAAMPRLATAGNPCPQEPWCAARLEIGLASEPRAAYWLADWERVLAWAWLSRVGAKR
jgi:hypothetical protein